MFLLLFLVLELISPKHMINPVGNSLETLAKYIPHLQSVMDRGNDVENLKYS